jgi:hypothetical protein
MSEKKDNFRFVISTYGDKYIGFLLVAIFSIIKSNSEAKISILWEDIDEKKIDLLTKVFPKVNFVKVDFKINSDSIKRISSKTIFWEHAVNIYQDEDLCLLDSDMLVLKDISIFFGSTADIIFTYKDGIYPLNTGIMLVKNSKKVANFFTIWKKKTIEILNNKEDFEKANSLKFPYGGADQMSFYNIIGYRKNVTDYSIEADDDSIKFSGIPCAILNETRSVQISNQTHVVHYKGGWRLILTEGANFTKNRPKKESFEMYLLYLKTFKEAFEMARKYDSDLKIKDFNITIPFYLDKNFVENKFRYLIFNIFNFIKRISTICIKFLWYAKSQYSDERI